MRDAANDFVLFEMSEFIKNRVGLDFCGKNLNKLKSNLRLHFLKYEKDDLSNFYRKIKESKDEFNKFVRELTTGETYFFRYPKQFHLLRTQVIPDLIKNSNDQNWISAACSTGEEPYSLAIQASESFGEKSKSIKISAIDLNQNSLEKAKMAVYGSNSFRTNSLHFRNVHFSALEKGLYGLNDDIKERVHFEQCNLVEPSSFLDNENQWDLIFCRNVLIYFEREMIEEIHKRLYKSLKVGGYLFLGHAEFLSLDKKEYPYESLSVSIYKKVTEISNPSAKKAVFSYKSNPSIVRLPKKEPIKKEEDDHSIKIDEDDTLEMSLDYYKKKELFKVEQLIGEVLKQSPNNRLALIIEAHLNTDKGLLELASKQCSKLIEADPLNPDHYFLRGIILKSTGNLKGSDAIEDFKRAIYCDENHFRSHFFLALTLEEFEGMEKAFSHYCWVLDLLDDHEDSNPFHSIDWPWDQDLTIDYIKTVCIQKISLFNIDKE